MSETHGPFDTGASGLPPSIELAPVATVNGQQVPLGSAASNPLFVTGGGGGSSTVSGTVTANQGTPASTSNAWPVALTIGGSLNASGSPLYAQLTPGTASIGIVQLGAGSATVGAVTQGAGASASPWYVQPGSGTTWSITAPQGGLPVILNNNSASAPIFDALSQGGSAVAAGNALFVQPGTGATWQLGAGSATVGAVTQGAGASGTPWYVQPGSGVTWQLGTGSATIGNVGLVAGTATIGTVLLGAGAASIGTVAVGASLLAAATNAIRINSSSGTNAFSLKGSAGRVYSLVLSNTTGSTIYFRLFNMASTPTPGSSTPILTLPILPNSTQILSFGDFGLSCSAGIGIDGTGGLADSDTTAIGAQALTGVITIL